VEAGVSPITAEDPKQQSFVSSVAKEKNRSSKVIDLIAKILMVVTILVTLLDLYWYLIPHDVKLNHKKILNEQMSKFAFSIRDQKEELKEEIEDVSERIVEEHLTLESGEKEADADKLQEAIEEDVVKLKELKEEQASLENTANFCPGCQFSWEGLITSCGKRRDYLINHHGSPKEDAEKAVIHWDSNCAN